MELPEENPSIFENVHTWLYTKEIKSITNGEDVPCNVNRLVELFIFGDKMGMPTFCNETIDLLIHAFEKENQVVAFFLARAWENTSAGSPLRKLLVATYVQHTNDLESFHAEFFPPMLACPDFLLDLAKAYSARRGDPPKKRHIADPCQYHQHAEGEKRCPKKETS